MGAVRPNERITCSRFFLFFGCRRVLNISIYPIENVTAILPDIIIVNLNHLLICPAEHLYEIFDRFFFLTFAE